MGGYNGRMGIIKKCEASSLQRVKRERCRASLASCESTASSSMSEDGAVVANFDEKDDAVEEENEEEGEG